MAANGETSQTAHEYIQAQIALEQEAREALPYQFDTCTRDLGPLRQNLFSCLTCNPPPSDPSTPFTPAGVCYACSISCHGEHDLVELFSRRDFECDCGTNRLPDTSPCSLRLNPVTGTKGDVRSQEPCATNKYNHNFRNRFCGCGELYDPHTEKGTMFQCIGLAAEEDGGCGEDWWHPECLMGLPRITPADSSVVKKEEDKTKTAVEVENEASHQANSALPEGNANLDGDDANDDDDTPLPPGFPAEDDFHHLICYKCVERQPWIKNYAGQKGFLQPLSNKIGTCATESNKRKAEDDICSTQDPKKSKLDEPLSNETDGEKASFAGNDEKEHTLSKDDTATDDIQGVNCTYPVDKHPLEGPFSLFVTEDFRSHLCRCPQHFRLLSPHPALLDEEDVYEPPVSEGSEARDGQPSEGSRSLYDRGEAALSNVDRVRAIEGVMAYNMMRDKVKDFLKPFAESGETVSAEAIKQYFERLRGDDASRRENGTAAASNEQ